MLKIIDEAVDGMILTSNQETTQEKILKLTRDDILYNIKISKDRKVKICKSNS